MMLTTSVSISYVSTYICSGKYEQLNSSAYRVVLLGPTATLSRKSDGKDKRFKPQFQVK